KVANRDESAQLVRAALNNTAGTARDIVALNAGLALYAGNRVDSIEAGIRQAFELIASGAARDKLEQFRQYTQRFSACTTSWLGCWTPSEPTAPRHGRCAATQKSSAN